MKKLPESLWTKVTNDVFNGYWPTWFRELWRFYVSYYLASLLIYYTIYWSTNYYDISFITSFLWLLTFLLYTFFEKINSKNVLPNSTTTVEWKYNLLFFITLLIYTPLFMIMEEYRSRCIKILVVKNDRD